MLGMLRRNDYDEPKVEGGGGKGNGICQDDMHVNKTF